MLCHSMGASCVLRVVTGATVADVSTAITKLSPGNGKAGWHEQLNTCPRLTLYEVGGETFPGLSGLLSIGKMEPNSVDRNAHLQL